MQLALDVILILLLSIDIVRSVHTRRTAQCVVDEPVEDTYSDEWVEVNEFFSEGEDTFKRILKRTDIISVMEFGEKREHCTIVTQDGAFVHVSDSYETVKALL